MVSVPLYHTGRKQVSFPLLQLSRQSGVRNAGDTRTLVLDIGSGFNTPSIVRCSVERVGAQLPNARLVRINPGHAEVPSELGERALAIACGAAETLAAVHAENR